jgi:HK97 family phage major capsid protein
MTDMNYATHDVLNPDRQVPREVLAGFARAFAASFPEMADLHQEPRQDFSFARMLLAQTNRYGDFDRREKEVCAGTALLLGRTFDPQRSYVPLGLVLQRTMTANAGGGSKGGYLVGSEVWEAWDTPRTWSVARAAGARLLTNLKHNITLPRDADAPNVSWIGETPPQVEETPPSLGEVSATPHTAIATVKFSMQLLRQGEAVESYIRERLARAVDEALDVVYFAGAGGTEPLGLLNVPGIGTQSGTSLAHAGLLAMRKNVLNGGALESGLQWVGTPAVQEVLGARDRISNGGRFLWDDNGILGKPAYATKNGAASALVCGDFAQSAICVWGPGLRIDVDPSQDFNSAGLVARVLLLTDVIFPQPAAFCVATSVT